MFQRFKKFSGELNLGHREEKDGRTEEDTVVTKALAKYYRDKGLEYPDWLGISPNEGTYGFKNARFPIHVPQQVMSHIPGPSAHSESTMHSSRPSNKGDRRGGRPRLQSRFSSTSEISRAGNRSTASLSRFGRYSNRGGSKSRFG